MVPNVLVLQVHLFSFYLRHAFNVMHSLAIVSELPMICDDFSALLKEFNKRG